MAALEAVRCLDKVVSLDRRHTRAHKMLAEVLYRVGAVNGSLKHLGALREVDAADYEIDTLQRRAVALVRDVGRPIATPKDAARLMRAA